MRELKDISKDLLTEMRHINKNSCIGWVGGTATDYIDNSEPYDYDLNVYGVSYDKIVDIVSKQIGVWRKAPKAGIVRAWAPSGKKIDIFLATRNFYSEEIGMWKWDLPYYKYLVKNNIHHKRAEKLSIKAGVPRFSNACLYIHYPSMELITEKKWLEDFKNKTCRALRNYSRYVISDYVRIFKYLASGYSLTKKTRKNFIENSLINYVCWNARRRNDNLISTFQDIFLRNLNKIYGYEDRDKEFYPFKFYEACRDSEIFFYLFSKKSEKKPENLSSKEEFMKSVFGNETAVLKEKVGQIQIIKDKFDFRWMN